DEVLDGEAEVVEAFLEAADGGAEALVALACVLGEFFELFALGDREGGDLGHQFGELGLELVFVHGGGAPVGRSLLSAAAAPFNTKAVPRPCTVGDPSIS